MLYLNVVKAIEDQIQLHTELAKVHYYRFSLPTSSVRSPFVCTPWTQISKYVSHANPCIHDEVTDYCVGNYADQHELTIPMLVGVAKHNSYGAEELLDELQNGVIEQIKASRNLGGAVQFAEPRDMSVDSFIEISPNFICAVLTIEVKYIDEPDIPDLNWIEELVNMQVFDETTVDYTIE